MSRKPPISTKFPRRPEPAAVDTCKKKRKFSAGRSCDVRGQPVGVPFEIIYVVVESVYVVVEFIDVVVEFIDAVVEMVDEIGERV